MQTFDVAVIGHGLLGTAAAKHLVSDSARPQSVIMIGPEETGPAVPAENTNRSLFGCHLDEGRITRVIDTNRTWSSLAKRSMRRYKDIEKESGIEFYHPVGFLALGTPEGGYMSEIKRSCLTEIAESLGIVTLRTEKELKAKFPFLNPPGGHMGLFEPRGGWVSARQQLKAQTEIAKNKGCVILPEHVQQITTEQDTFTITTETGKSVQAKKVLLATGAQTNFRELLPAQKKLALSLRTQTVLFLELNNEDAERLKDMPSIICGGSGKFGCYILPPIQYPDGKVYLKIGHGEEFEKEIKNLEELQAWYRGHGDPKACESLRATIDALIPGLHPVSTRSDACVTTHTATGFMYIDMLQPHLGILVGGCGYAAKSADEIGLLGAELIRNEKWVVREYPDGRFQLVLASQQQAKL